jgi:hypothetical protein
VRPDNRETLILKFASDRVVAHQSLFAHRHPDATPPFHDELTELWHSSASKVLTLAFRGGGKSTLAEEALVLAAAMKLVRNVLIIGSNSDRANGRLRAIKHELETNELLVELYGDLRGPVWNEGRIVLANGVCIQAFGRGQALRGVKHHDARPDFCFVDDVEDWPDPPSLVPELALAPRTGGTVGLPLCFWKRITVALLGERGHCRSTNSFTRIIHI